MIYKDKIDNLGDVLADVIHFYGLKNLRPIRSRKHYDKNVATTQTKVNILTVLSAEQQTHNFYAEHGFMYADHILRETYAEIKDVEEEHVTMYESLIDPSETMFEKLLIHEFTEVSHGLFLT